MKRNRGVALIIALLVIMVLSILSSTMLSRGITEHRNTWRFISGVNAFWLAEAGLQRGLYEINRGAGAWTGWTDVNGEKQLQSSLTGMGDFDIVITHPLSETPRVRATGHFPGRDSADVISRTLTVRLSRSDSLFTYAAFGGSSVTVRGLGTTDSYDSSLGPYDTALNRNTNGDVGTNGDISASGNAYIYGDASTGDEGTFDDTTRVSGTISHENDVELQPVSVPESLQTLASGGTINSSTTITAGDYKYHSINLAGKNAITITGPANIYLTSSTSLSVSALARIVISSTSTGPIKIYADGDIDLSGQGIVNESQLASQLILYGTSTTQQVSITGQGDFYGAIYAPTAHMDLSGQGVLYGSFVGDTVDISGGGGVHYDETLSQVPTGAERFRIAAWQDTQRLFPVSAE